MTAKSKIALESADKILSEMDENARVQAMTYIAGFAAGYEAKKGEENEKDLHRLVRTETQHLEDDGNDGEGIR